MTKIVGRILEDKIEWPETDVLGRPYTRPWAKEHFVTDSTFVMIQGDMNDEVKAALARLFPAEKKAK